MKTLNIECRGINFKLTTEHSQSSYEQPVLATEYGAAFGALDDVELPGFMGPEMLGAADIVRGAYLKHYSDPETPEWTEEAAAFARRFYQMDPTYRGAE